MKQKIQINADNLATLCLENGETYHNYSDEDLLNATLIFSHFFMDKIYSENQHLSKDKKLELAETGGKAIRELIKTSCGKDMHEVTKNLKDKK